MDAQKKNKLLILEMIVIFLISSVSCSWAEKKVESKQLANTENRALEWKGDRPDECPHKMKISRIRTEKSLFAVHHMMAVDGKCSIYLAITETEKELNWSLKMISVFLPSGEFVRNDLKIPVKSKFDGWAWKFSWNIDSEGKKWEFILHMKQGSDNNPFEML